MIFLQGKIALRVFQLATVAIGLVVIGSCGGGSETISEQVQSEDGVQNDTPDGSQVSTLADATWKLGDAVYVTDFNGGTAIQNNSADDHTIVKVGDRIFDMSNGVYSGGVLEIMLSTTGSGDYVVTDASNSTLAYGTGAKTASIEVTAGVISTDQTRWDSTTTSGTLTVRVNADGRYFVSTTEPIIVTRAFETGTGVVGSPENISLEMQSINGVPIPN